jgi:hypothetical protein
MRIVYPCAAALVLCVSLGSGQAGGAPYKDVVITAIDPEAKTIVVSGEPKVKAPLHADASTESRLPQLHEGDHLAVDVADEGGVLNIRSIVLLKSYVAVRQRIGALAGVGLLWLLLGLVLARGNVLGLIKGEDGRYSNSKFQGVLWFSIVIVTYGATVILRGLRLGVDIMWVDIPAHLLALSGLSAFSFGAAKGITVSKIEAATAAGIAAPKATPSAGILKDLTTNDANQLDLGDFQMLVVTLVAAASYLVIAFNALGMLDAIAGVSLKDVDTTILASFGLGQGAYLAKKALGHVGIS